MNSIKLSVITINRNNAQGLAKTFASVNNQTETEFEFIVIDGASSDKSTELIHQNSRINYWVSEKDNGVYHAMNKGIRAASGDYVIFLNSGDAFFDNRVVEQVYPFLNNETGVVYGNSVFINSTGYYKEHKAPAELSFGFFVHNGLNHQATFIKRSLFFKYFLYNEQYKMYSDWEFFIYVLCAGNEPYKYVDLFICNYDYSGLSAHAETRSKFEMERQQTFQKYFPLMLNDIKRLEELRTKRMQDIVYIKRFPAAWRVLKWVMDLLLIFLPKKIRNS
jgi:glycosyltransferase involved in cell wall biosynthesis